VLKSENGKKKQQNSTVSLFLNQKNRDYFLGN